MSDTDSPKKPVDGAKSIVKCVLSLVLLGQVYRYRRTGQKDIVKMGNENPNPDGTSSTSGTEGTEGVTTPTTPTLPEGVTAEDNGEIVIINGKKFVVQDKVNTLVGNARTEGKQTGKTEAEQAAERARQEAENQNLTEQGQFKTLYDSEKTAREKAEQERDRIQADFDAYKSDITRKTIAREAGIPEDQADRIRGNTEQEMKDDAAKLAAIIKPVTETKPIDTQTGHKEGPTGTETPTTPTTNTERKVPYAFQSRNEVKW